MKLLTQAMRAQLPMLYATEHICHADKMAVCKFFTPDSSWTWFVCEAGVGEDLDDTAHVLCEGGILIYIVPKSALGIPAIARHLAGGADEAG